MCRIKYNKDGRGKTKAYLIRVTDDLSNYILDSAKKLNITKTDFVRDCVIEKYYAEKYADGKIK